MFVLDYRKERQGGLGSGMSGKRRQKEEIRVNTSNLESSAIIEKQAGREDRKQEERR
jgi:hypothetical protein